MGDGGRGGVHLIGQNVPRDKVDNSAKLEVTNTVM